jgi:competence CoiA-like predicted nuclease
MTDRASGPGTTSMHSSANERTNERTTEFERERPRCRLRGQTRSVQNLKNTVLSTQVAKLSTRTDKLVRAYAKPTHLVFEAHVGLRTGTVVCEPPFDGVTLV